MDFERKSGILLHPTSLPGAFGIGELGPEARRFAGLLGDMGQGLWQVLPMGPTGYGDSPYQSFSSFAGNHLLISFDQLAADSLLNGSRLRDFPGFPGEHVEYGGIIPERMKILRSVCRTFGRRASPDFNEGFRRFCLKQGYWLEDYALFIALKEAHGGGSWIEWPEELIHRDPAALNKARRKYRTSIRYTKILQYLFHRQWDSLKRHCNNLGVSIIGDIPIFVAHDSADVWANPELFSLDYYGKPVAVAGVPPDYFSETGQLWGNPTYRWDEHRRQNFAWWISRMKKNLEMYDIIRIDHFRGFDACWEVPAGETTAVNGRWVDAPGDELFSELIKKSGPLPIIAEDLGIITHSVEKLRDGFNFPGMRVLQFSFGDRGSEGKYLPENCPSNCVVYTGTHDNDTVVGWFHSEPGEGTTRTREEIVRERESILDCIGTDGSEIHWDLINLALQSNAVMSIIPMQDLMGLGSKSRMNVPGRPSGNWKWRFTWDRITPDIVERMRRMTQEAGR